MQQQFRLLRMRRYLPIFLTQFFGAFNDNLFKNGMLVLIAYGGLSYAGFNDKALTNAAAGVFILPFFLFSALAGQLAERFDMALLARCVKGLEILIMSLAAYGFVAGSAGVLMLCLFLMGTHSSLFGPIKYAILPQYLRSDELVGGNALIEMATFIAILLGQITGAQLQDLFPHRPWVLASVCLSIAGLGALSSLAMPRLNALDVRARVDAHILRASLRLLRQSASEKELWHVLLAISWFWFFGAVYLTQWVVYARDVLGGQASLFTLLIALFSIGIGLGAVLCESLSGRRVELALVPLAAIAISVFAIDLYGARPAHPAHHVAAWDFVRQGHLRLLADIFLMGVSCGLFTVPLYAHLQQRSKPTFRARVIAANNILNALFMVVASVVSALLLAHGLNVPQLMLFVAVLNAVLLIALLFWQPIYGQRLLLWWWGRAYRQAQLVGGDLLPQDGGVLLLLTPEVDPALLLLLLPRPALLCGDLASSLLPAACWTWIRRRSAAVASGATGNCWIAAQADAACLARLGGDGQAPLILQVARQARGLRLQVAQALP